MPHAGYSSHTAPFLQTITDNQIHEIKQAAFLILERTGCRVNHKKALTLLKSAGAHVNGEQVYVPRYLIEDALAKVPKGFTLYNREGEPAMDLSGRKSYFGSSTASPSNRHALEKEIRPTTLTDIAWGAKTADALPNLDFVMPFGSAQDVPGEAGELYEFETVVQNTTKPIFFCGYSSKGVELVLQMAAEVAGGENELSRKPFLVAYPEPITPLQFPHEVVERIFVCASRHMPQITCGAQLTGFTSPVTLAGSLALATAESFFGILLAQLCRSGAPCFLTSGIGAANMRTGIAMISCPEQTLSLAAQAQLARTIGLPTWGLAGATDAKRIDAQAGAEAALDIALQALSGVSVIHDTGYMDMGMACSCAMMVLGDEIISWVKRFIQGIEVSAETLAAEVTHHVGPGGNYLTQQHTLDHMRKESWQPELFCKDSIETWRKQGAKTLEERADERVAQIIETHKPKPLPDPIIEALQHIRKQGEIQLLN
jgi:trimethylamine---corrinoid protein Co-methyltransferase